MNNRIMAMLFALVAAMFISIVPVKAEAACACADTNYDHLCDTCGTVVHTLTKTAAKEANHAEAGNVEYYTCTLCGKKFADKDAKTQIEAGKEVLPKIEHELKWTVDEKGHKQACTGCGYVPVAQAAHNYSGVKAVDNKDGTHSFTCNVEGCGYVLSGKHNDTDKNCKCDNCGAALEHNLADWGKDTNSHWKTCLTCGTNFEVGEHKFGEPVAKGDGKIHSKTCADCGQVNEYYCADSETDADCVCDECGGAMPHNKDEARMVSVYKDPTCTETGLMQHWKCKVCGQLLNASNKVVTEAEVTSKALGHDFKKAYSCDDETHYHLCQRTGCEAKDQEAEHEFKYTDNGDGTHSAQCKVCGRKPAKLQNVKHVWGEAEGADGKTHKLTCVDCAYATRQTCADAAGDGDCLCDSCGVEIPHTDTSKMTYVEAKAPTCTEAGNTDYYECGECGGTFLSDGTEWDPALEALGHDWKAKPDTLNGQHLQKCARCSAFQTLGHEDTNGDCLCDVNDCGSLVHSHKMVPVAEKAATCTEEGTEAYYTYEGCGKMFDLYQKPITAPKAIPAKGHDFGDEWIPCEGGIHAKFCANCDEFQTEEHKFLNGNVICSVCGGEEELTYVAAKAATCTDNGSVEYWASKVTGKKYADAAGTTLIADVTVPATGHDMSGWEDLGNGQGHKQVCMNAGCRHELTENHDNVNGCFCTECGGFKNGHTNELVEAVPATCSKAGTQAHFKCSCGKLYDLSYNPIDKAGSIAQLKHVMGTEVKKDAKEGKHYIQCKNCTYKMYEEHAMVLSDPLKGNYHQYLCECGELKIETHTDKNGDNKCDVCNHNMSGSNVTVEQHNNQTVVTGQSDKVVSTKNWWWNWQEMFTPSNSGGTAATEKPAENNTSSNVPANNGTAEKAPATNGSANSGSANNGGSNAGAPTVSAPSASQTNVLVQFINWFLGLFGF